MAVLFDPRNQRSLAVEPELIIGRAWSCGLRLDRPYVSACHAALRWAGSHWELRDLGSRNGTFLNGTALQPGREYPLVRGVELAFGHRSECWQLTDDGPPQAMAIPLDGGDPLVVEKDVLVMPSDQTPEASLYRDSDGTWKLEDLEGNFTVLENNKMFQVGARPFRFSCPESVGSTSAGSVLNPFRPVTLRFAVSADEEHVELSAISGDRTFELGSRAHNYLLLTLARARLEDLRSGIPEASSGWIYQDDLLRGLDTTSTQLNIDIFRIRQHFAKAGLQDAFSVIERRPRTRQLRIGTSNLEIVRL
ncbi:MAG: FHA domain-containing protein [Pseudomonadota bacterium]